MINVFISYCHKDEKLIAPFLKHLYSFYFGNKPCFKLWIDKKDIIPGDNLSKSINQGIHISDIAILCLTENYLKSKSCLQEKNKFLELRNSSEHKRVRVLPLIFDQCAWMDDIELKDINSLNSDAIPYQNSKHKNSWLLDVMNRLILLIYACFSDGELMEKGNLWGKYKSIRDCEWIRNTHFDSKNEKQLEIKFTTDSSKREFLEFLKEMFPDISLLNTGCFSGEDFQLPKYLIRGNSSYLYNILCVISWNWGYNALSNIDYEDLIDGFVCTNRTLRDTLIIFQNNVQFNNNI